MWSARRGNTNELAYILEKSPNNLSSQMNDALQHASVKNHLETVNLLVNKGADISHESYNAIRHASKNGHISVVEFLIQESLKQNPQCAEQLHKVLMNKHHFLFKKSILQSKQQAVKEKDKGLSL